MVFPLARVSPARTLSPSFEVYAQHGRGVKRVGRRRAPFLSRAATRIRALFPLLALTISAVSMCAAIQISPAPPKATPPPQVAPGQVATGQTEDRQSTLREGPEPINATEINQMPVPTPLEFQSRGLDYEALTRDNVTVMFSPLPPHIKDFNIIQITVTNGSAVSWTVKPEDFVFVRQDGSVLESVSADYVVESLLQRASRNDVIKLQMLYENTIYALQNFRSTNGYEQRREAAMAQFVNRGFKAAAAASAITFVATKLRSGESTDGAIFFMNRSKEKGLGAGRLAVRTCGQIFLFQVYGELKVRP
jgi:hypothetical protein